MSEYYLADLKAEERSRQRQREPEPAGDPRKSQDMKVTLLGDFLFPTAEAQGCDPYNSTQGKSVREVWRGKHDRR